jgi:hypothetical protein
MRHVLELNGITGPKWEAIRKAGFTVANSAQYVTPDRVRSLADDVIEPIVAGRISEARAAIKSNEKFALKREQIIKDGRRELEMDLHRYYADETSYAVIETDAASRRIARLGTRPGTVPGEVVRFIMQFKGFPIAFTQRVFGRALFNAAEGRAGQAAHIGTLMAGLTVAGYMAMTTKDAARGKWPPRDPTDPNTLAAAAMQGGAVGIYGDFLFGEASRFGQGPVETLSGPFIGTAADIYNLAMKAKGGDPDAGKALDVLVNNTPFINMFYTRPAIDFLFLNELRDTARPGYLRRQEQRAKSETGQDYFLPRTLGQALR